MIGGLKSRKFKVCAIIALAIVILGCGVAYWFFIRSDNAGIIDQNNTSSTETIEQAIVQANKFFALEKDRIGKLAVGVTEPEDLAGVAEVDRGKVGLGIINKAVLANELDKANTFIDSLMKGEDNSALDTTLVCYQIAENAERKNQCLNRMNELSRILGIIGQNETLPASYYSNATEQN